MFYYWQPSNYYLLRPTDMKYLFIFATLFVHSFSFAQAKDRVKEKPFHFSVEGEVNQKINFTLEDAAKYNSVLIDSLVIYNHLMEKRKTYKNIKGILLKDVITAAGIKMEKPKLLSEFYFTCIAHDGYKVVFSWNELFNTAVGKKVLVVTSIDGKAVQDTNDGMIILSAADEATGRRLVYDLEKTIVNRVP